MLMRSLLLILLFAATARAEIIESNHYQDVVKYLTSDTLFVTDLDNTLIRPPQTIGSDQWGTAVQADFAAKGYPKDQVIDMGVGLFALVQMKTKMIPVESETPALLDQIANQGVPTLGLTARPLNIVDRTVAQVKAIGAHLTGFNARKLDLEFGNGTLAYKGGVLFVGAHNDKGLILKQLLKANHLTMFKRIVYIDDKAHHTQAMEDAFAGSVIEIKAIRYGATDSIVKNYDPVLAQEQFAIFSLTGKIIPDEEVNAAAVPRD